MAATVEHRPADGKSRFAALLHDKRIWLLVCFAAALLGFGIIPLLTNRPNWQQAVAIGSTELIFSSFIVAFLYRGQKAARSGAAGERKADEDQKREDVSKTSYAVLIFVVFGLVALACFASSVSNPLVAWREFARTVGAGCLYAGAFFAAGALAGFLFGIPRSVPRRQSDRASTGKDPAAAKDSAADTVENRRAESPFATNTNLEDISDWLTKIIVGLGLINLKEIPQKLKALSWYFAQVCGSGLCDPIALALMIHFFIAGFFLTYLMTRLYLTGAFTRAEGPPPKTTVEPTNDLPIKGIPATDDLQVIASVVSPKQAIDTTGAGKGQEGEK
jgi:hypothetical protein